MTKIERAARTVYETFVRDLADGYRNHDKIYAVTILGKALGLPTVIERETKRSDDADDSLR